MLLADHFEMKCATNFDATLLDTTQDTPGDTGTQGKAGPTSGVMLRVKRCAVICRTHSLLALLLAGGNAFVPVVLAPPAVSPNLTIVLTV